jgi:hypothetical protein
MHFIKNIFSSLYIKNKIDYLLLIPLTFSCILFIIFPFIYLYYIYILFIANNILYIIPLILYIIIVYCLITDLSNYFILLLQKLVVNFLFILYIICYINTLIFSPLYALYLFL